MENSSEYQLKVNNKPNGNAFVMVLFEADRSFGNSVGTV